MFFPLARKKSSLRLCLCFDFGHSLNESAHVYEEHFFGPDFSHSKRSNLCPIRLSRSAVIRSSNDKSDEEW